jgi:hypothetical protein
MDGSAILAAIEAAAAEDDSSWTASERSRDLLELLEASRQLEAHIQRLAGQATERSGTA